MTSAYGFTSGEEVAKNIIGINERGRRIALQIDETIQDILKDYNETRKLGCKLKVSIPEVSGKETNAGIWELMRGRFNAEVRVVLYHNDEKDRFRLMAIGDSTEEIKRVLDTYLPGSALMDMESE